MSTKRVSKKIMSEKKANTLKIDQDVWPIERDVFFRPARMKYVRKILKPKGCVFCNSALRKENVNTLCVYKTKYSQIVINKFPYNTGHVLILPLRHEGEILSLSKIEYDDLHETLKLAIQAVKKIYNPNGFNIGMNHGASGGAGIPGHIHYHIVPRWHGDLNFFPLIAETKLVIENVSTTYKKLRTYFLKNKKIKGDAK